MRRPLPALLVSLLLAALAAPAGAGAHGGTDHGERVVDGRLVEVEASAPPGTSLRGRAGESWRATGPRPLAIVQVLMPGRDVTRYPAYTEDQLRSAFVTGAGSASRALSEMTAGKVSLTGIQRSDGDVLPAVTAPSSGTCDWQGWAASARNQLAAQGRPLTAYLSSGNVAYVLVGPTGCEWGGLAWMPGTEIWLDNSLTRSLVVHELGHNFSLDHAASARCTANGTRAFLTSSCTLSEYGDPFDPMGYGDRHYSATHRRMAGWLDSGAVRTVATSGTFLLQPAADPLSSVRMLRVPRPDGRDLTIELRKPYGTFDAFAPSDPAVNGVLLRLHDPDGADQRSQLLDAVPSTTTWSDAALPVGRTVTDAITGISVRLDALDGEGATVTVAVPGGTADTTAPSTPDPAAVVEGTDVLLSWPAATDDTGVTAYRVSRDGQLLGQTAARTWTDAPGPGEHVYVVTAMDAAGNATSSKPLAVALRPPAPPPPAPPAEPQPPAPDPLPVAPVTEEPVAEEPVAPVVVRRWRTPSSVRVDGRRRAARGLASRGGSALRGRTVIARFSGAVRELRVSARGCTPRLEIRTGSRWRSLPRLRSARASVRTSRAVREVRVRCAGRARVALDQLAGR